MGFLFFMVSRAKLLHGGGSCRKRDPSMGWGCGQQGVLWQGSVVDFISFISRLKYWGVGQYYDEIVESLGVLL